MSQEWEVEFDVLALLEREFPGLYRPEDDEDWDGFAKWAGYRRDAAKELVKILGIRPSLKARAVLARFLPAEFLPFCWKDKEDDDYGLPPSWQRWSIPEDLERLRYEVLCEFMEALPKSVEFDLSDHPVAKHLPRLNGSLFHGYLFPNERGPRDWDWFDLDRVFRCYRLQNLGSNSGEPYHAFQMFTIHADKTQHAVWRGQVNSRMLEAVKRDIEGDSECSGALASYTKLALEEDDTQEAGPAYSKELAMLLYESYLGLPLPWRKDSHGSIFYHYITYGYGLKAKLLELGGRRYLTGPNSLVQAVEDREKNWHFLARLARALIEKSKDEELLVIARPIVEKDDRLESAKVARRAARDEAEGKEKEARAEATLRLFERMREKK